MFHRPPIFFHLFASRNIEIRIRRKFNSGFRFSPRCRRETIDSPDSFYELYAALPRFLSPEIFHLCRSFSTDFIGCPDFMQAFLRKLRRRNEQWVHSTHPLREQDRRWDSLGGDEVGNRPVRCKTSLYALSSLSYSVSSNETARNPFAAILSRARSPLLLFLSRRVLIFRTRTEKRGVGGKLFSLGTRRLFRRISLLSKGITINFSSLFFFLFNSKRKIFGWSGVIRGF